MELTLTQENSDIQVLFNKEENYLILDFIYDAFIYQTLRQMESANYNDILEYKWVLPISSLKELNKMLHGKILWKSPEEMKKDTEYLTITEETLEDVLSRMPKNIETPFMNIEPYDFQKVAVSWAITPKGKRGNIYGGLLGDTMGLGKTIEALAISGYLKQMGKINNCLVICPATLKLQWGQEISRFTNEKAVVVEGDKKKRAKIFEKIEVEQPFYTVINYELLKQRERPKKEINKTDKYKKTKTPVEKGEYTDLQNFWEDKYDMVIIDEAHRMKNPDAETSKAIRLIQPKYRLLMTGTPIEKDLHNIFQLVDYLSPNIFSSDSYSFDQRRKMFEEQFLVTTWNPFTKWKREKMIVGVKNVGILKKTLAPYMLRRTTLDVSDELPSMIGADAFIPSELDADQKALLNELKKELKVVQDMRKLVKNQEQADKVDNKMNEILLYMLEVCDHPNLLLFGQSNMAKQLVKKRLGKTKTSFPDPPKFSLTMDKIEDIMRATDEKIVIFSKYERMTRILKDGIMEISKRLAKENKSSKKNQDFNIMMYTGETDKTCKWKSHLEKNNQTPGKLECNVCPFVNECNSRTKSAWFFQNDPETRIIIATDAGNYGVNLQTGKHLINYDLPDSFSIYDQRNGRIQRLGSTHDKVHIYNIVTQDGVDMKKFYKILEQKEIAEYVVEKTEFEEDAVIRATKSMNGELIKDLLKG